MSPKQQFDKIRLNSVFPPTVSPFFRLFDPAFSMSVTEASRKALNEQPPLLLCDPQDRDLASH